MASNFRIIIQRKNRNMDLKLVGDFDGTSACELLNALKDNSTEAKKVVVDTSGLREIYPFGSDTFKNNLYQLKDLPFCLTFVGDNVDVIEPQKNRFF